MARRIMNRAADLSMTYGVGTLDGRISQAQAARNQQRIDRAERNMLNRQVSSARGSGT